LTAELRAFISHVTGGNNDTPFASGKVGLEGVTMVSTALKSAGRE